MWVHSATDNPEKFRLPGVHLAMQPTTDQAEYARRRRTARMLEAKQARAAQVKATRAETEHERIREFLRTMPQGETVESVADRLDESCKVVRRVVQELKANGELIEAAHRSHVLIRVTT